MIISTMQLAHCYPNFENHPSITKEMRKRIEPHLLPLDHPAKPILDKLFSKKGITETLDSLVEAGFITVSVRPTSYVIVVKHPALPGYLMKIYLESETRIKQEREGWEWLTFRCIGAKNIRNVIKEKKLKYFSVPDKYLYPLPIASGAYNQPIILICTEMHLLDQEKTNRIWMDQITKEHLKELYELLCVGGSSPHVRWNMPFTKEGKFTCIDTEHPFRRPNFKVVNKYLSPKNAKLWNKIVKKREKGIVRPRSKEFRPAPVRTKPNVQQGIKIAA